MDTSPYIAETSFHVRYAETDAMGITHHASYIVYFEVGRSNYIRERGKSYAEFEKTGKYLVVSEINARYIKAAKYDDLITVRTWVTQARSRSLTFEYEICLANTKEILMTGTSTHVCIDTEGKIAKIPAEWQAWVS